MYKNPLVLGIDGVAAHNIALEPQALLANYGSNTGNLVFSEGVYRSLKNVKRSPYAYAPQDAEQADAIVIAAANWLNPYSDFDNLAQRLESTKLPIIVVGVGAQATLERKIPQLKPGTLRLAQLISDRSTALSARGDFTAEVLNHYGIKNVEATGCPSLLLSGKSAPVIDRSRMSGPLAIHATRHLMNMADPNQARIYREGLKQNLTLVLQSELAEIILQREEGDVAAAKALLARVYANQDARKVSAYVKEKAKVFYTLEDWTAFLATTGPCVGTRIHGTVAALLAGTPALLIAHDYRTLEMAQKMSIPYVLLADVKDYNEETLRDLVAQTSFDDLSARYPSYRDAFVSFFTKNNLEVSDALL